jgi:hypothetical protein
MNFIKQGRHLKHLPKQVSRNPYDSHLKEIA